MQLPKETQADLDRRLAAIAFRPEPTWVRQMFPIEVMSEAEELPLRMKALSRSWRLAELFIGLDHVLKCRRLRKDGQHCQADALHGFDSCWTHMTNAEREFRRTAQEMDVKQACILFIVAAREAIGQYLEANGVDVATR